MNDLQKLLRKAFRPVKGTVGEFSAHATLKLLREKNIFRDLYIPTKGGNHAQIDLLVLTHNGIVVIENKNYSGWVFGSLEQKNWTQTFPNGTKFPFYNPIKQNQGHIKALSYFLNLPDMDCFQSCILFSPQCELKDVPSDVPNVAIIQNTQLKDYMNHVHQGLTPQLSPDDLFQIIEKLKTCQKAPSEVKESHREYVKSVQTAVPTSRKTATEQKEAVKVPVAEVKKVPVPEVKKATVAKVRPQEKIQVTIVAQNKMKPERGAWAVLIEEGGIMGEIHGFVEESPTNNRNYVRGLLDGLRALEGKKNINIVCDSKYLVENMPRISSWSQNDWTLSNGNPAKNADLWAEILPLWEQCQGSIELMTETHEEGKAAQEIVKSVLHDKDLPEIQPYSRK